jgi:hypothetical protein
MSQPEVLALRDAMKPRGVPYAFLERHRRARPPARSDHTHWFQGLLRALGEIVGARGPPDIGAKSTLESSARLGRRLSGQDPEGQWYWFECRTRPVDCVSPETTRCSAAPLPSLRPWSMTARSMLIGRAVREGRCPGLRRSRAMLLCLVKVLFGAGGAGRPVMGHSSEGELLSGHAVPVFVSGGGPADRSKDSRSVRAFAGQARRARSSVPG